MFFLKDPSTWSNILGIMDGPMFEALLRVLQYRASLLVIRGSLHEPDTSDPPAACIIARLHCLLLLLWGRLL